MFALEIDFIGVVGETPFQTLTIRFAHHLCSGIAAAVIQAGSENFAPSQYLQSHINPVIFSY